MGYGIKPKRPLLLCTFCNTQIPRVELDLKDNSIQLEIACNTCVSKKILLDHYLQNNIQEKREFNCTFPVCKIKDTPSKEIKYCVNCQYWICSTCIKLHNLEADNQFHSFTNYRIEINCSIHPKAKLLYYWKDENIFLCRECQFNAHEALYFKQKLDKVINRLQNDIKAYQEILKRNESTMTDTENVLLKTNNQALANITKEFYSRNKTNNKNIIELIQRILYTYQSFKQFPNCNLFKTSEEFQLNETQMNQKITLDNWDETYQQFCIYLQYNYIVNIKDINFNSIKQSDLIESIVLNRDNNNHQHDNHIVQIKDINTNSIKQSDLIESIVLNRDNNNHQHDIHIVQIKDINSNSIKQSDLIESIVLNGDSNNHQYNHNNIIEGSNHYPVKTNTTLLNE